MNLENLGVQEMSAQEVKNVDGGFLAIAAIILAAGTAYYGLGYAVGEAWQNYDNSKK